MPLSPRLNLPLLAGLAVLALAWTFLEPLRRAHGFSGHMVVHLAVVALASPLLALGLARTRFDPARRLPRLFAAVPAAIAELVLVWGWHAPAARYFALTSPLGTVLEQASFLTAGLLLWGAALGGGPNDAKRAAAGTLALLLTSMHMTVLGVLLSLSPRPLYSAFCLGSPLLAPLDDQRLGGVLMLGLGGAAYLAGGLYLASRLLRRPARAPA